MACAIALVSWRAPETAETVEPVMVVELAAQAAAPMAQPAVQPETSAPTPLQPITPPTSPRIEAPPAPRIMSSDPVAVPQQPVQPVARIEAAAPAPAAPASPVRAVAEVARTGIADAPGTDEKAKKQEADYYAQLASYLNRKKSYPAEAKKARQQGIVAVRFTVSRSGDVGTVTIRRSSGHDILDQATLDLLRRVAPLPAFPASMKQANATITVPIEYSLRTS